MLGTTAEVESNRSDHVKLAVLNHQTHVTAEADLVCTGATDTVVQRCIIQFVDENAHRGAEQKSRWRDVLVLSHVSVEHN